MRERPRTLELRLGGTRLRLHPLALLMPLLALRLGPPGDTAALLAALLCHETAHLAAAKLLHVRVNALTLFPFGGSMDIGNPYALSPGRLFAVALAGPLGNLLAVLAASALAQAGWLGPRPFLDALGANLTLMLFNLLPALPLDGGRMLYALLAPKLGRNRAARIGELAGYGVAAALAALSLLGWRRTGRLNLSPLFAGAFLLAAGPGERRALADTRARALLNALKPVGAPVPARVVAVGGGCAVREALACAAPDAATIYAIYDGPRLAGLTDDRQLITLAAEGKMDERIGKLKNLPI